MHCLNKILYKYISTFRYTRIFVIPYFFDKKYKTPIPVFVSVIFLIKENLIFEELVATRIITVFLRLVYINCNILNITEDGNS